MAEPGIHASAPRNDLTPDQLHLRPDLRGELTVTPATAGWRYLSFRTAIVDAATTVEVGGPDVETVVVLIAGADAVLERPGEAAWRVAGRLDPFQALPSGWYLPPGTAGPPNLRGVRRERPRWASAAPPRARPR